MKLINSFVCMTKDIGLHGNLFGGNMLRAIDEAGAILACEVCKVPRMVTVKMDEVIFLQPVKVGNVIKLYGDVEKVGNSSITLRIEARRYNVYTMVEIPVCSTKITFVRIDEDSNSIPINEEVKLKYKK